MLLRHRNAVHYENPPTYPVACSSACKPKRKRASGGERSGQRSSGRALTGRVKEEDPDPLFNAESSSPYSYAWTPFSPAQTSSSSPSSSTLSLPASSSTAVCSTPNFNFFSQSGHAHPFTQNPPGPSFGSYHFQQQPLLDSSSLDYQPSYNQSGSYHPSDLGLDLASHDQDLLPFDASSSSSDAIPTGGVGQLDLSGLTNGLGGEPDWTEMLDTWAGGVDDEWESGPDVVASFLANEVARGAAGGSHALPPHSAAAAAALQHHLPPLPTFVVATPPLSSPSDAAAPSTPSSSSIQTPPASSSSGSSSNRVYNDDLPSSHQLQLYSSSLRTFAQGILSSLPQISITPPQLRPLSVAFKLNRPLLLPSTPRTPTQPQRQPGSEFQTHSTLRDLSPTASSSLTIQQRRAARNERTNASMAFGAQEEEQEQQWTTAEWFALQTKRMGKRRERERERETRMVVA